MTGSPLLRRQGLGRLISPTAPLFIAVERYCWPDRASGASARRQAAHRCAATRPGSGCRPSLPVGDEFAAVARRAALGVGHLGAGAGPRRRRRVGVHVSSFCTFPLARVNERVPTGRPPHLAVQGARPSTADGENSQKRANMQPPNPLRGVGARNLTYGPARTFCTSPKAARVFSITPFLSKHRRSPRTCRRAADSRQCAGAARPDRRAALPTAQRALVHMPGPLPRTCPTARGQLPRPAQRLMPQLPRLPLPRSRGSWAGPSCLAPTPDHRVARRVGECMFHVSARFSDPS